MEQHRIEKDSLGEVKVPKNAYWGAQTQRGIENFPVSGTVFPPVFIRSVALIKKACASVNRELGLLEPRLADVIVQVCDEIAGGKLGDQFPLDIFQTGSGTSTNMNVNEVIATRANEILTGGRHTRTPVHPNEHVNVGQSSNDVIPTAIHVAACLQVRDQLLPAMEGLGKAIRAKQKRYGSVLKTGRTHLMDAMPMTLAQEMSAWAVQVENARERIGSALPRLSELAIGGTAVGTGVNTPKGFGSNVAKRLSEMTKFEFREAPSHFEAQSAQDAVVELSGQLKTYATALIKISNDLRWMNSGPLAGLGEIRLPALQPGSSIMPGKVNPVIPEAVRMAATQVIGNDVVITLSNAQGEFQLNVMLPVMAHNILQSIDILAGVSRLLAEKAIAGFDVDEERMAESLMKNPIIATVLNPIIGYDKAAEVVKKAMKEKKSVKELAVEMGYLSKEEAERVFNPAKMTEPT
jgi:fumarate hydratase class II